MQMLRRDHLVQTPGASLLLSGCCVYPHFEGRRIQGIWGLRDLPKVPRLVRAGCVSREPCSHVCLPTSGAGPAAPRSPPPILSDPLEGRTVKHLLSQSHQFWRVRQNWLSEKTVFDLPFREGPCASENQEDLSQPGASARQFHTLRRPGSLFVVAE